MDRLAIWPDFRQDWIVYDDGDLVVVDKPEGISCQAADPDRPDDLVTRLRAHLHGAYVGVHQRLDQDTSGLLVYARRKEANASLAAQFEGRTVRKTYVACVTGWPRSREQATLRGAIAPDHGGAMRVVATPTRDAKAAVTGVRVLSRVGDRAMLELELKTGRTHQARVQLAHAGAPVAGDGLYGGAQASRLLLHASGIELSHPLTGRPVRFASAPPPDFRAWLEDGEASDTVYDGDDAIAARLARAVGRRWALGRSEPGPCATTAFRLVNEEGDGLPRLAVDAYGEWVVVQLYGDDGPWALPVRRERVLDRVHALGFRGVYLKVRPKAASASSGESREHRLASAPPHPVRGEPAPEELIVLEEGVPLRVRLGDGFSTGLFADQRLNRQRVRAAASGQAVANLFAYTCAFTVVAALGGARRTVSVDASPGALERGRANLEAAGVGLGSEHHLVASDVFTWLDRARRRGERFGLVVLDPPSFSTTKRGAFVADSDYVRLAASVFEILERGGRVLACTNHRGVTRRRFRRMLHDAARAAKRDVSQMKDLPAPQDFPTPAGGEPHTKSVWVSCA